MHPAHKKRGYAVTLPRTTRKGKTIMKGKSMPKRTVKAPKEWDANELSLIDLLGKTTTAVHSETRRALQLHGPFHSAHEAYGVILEELDEFWDLVKTKKQFRNKAEMRKELIQVAATAIKAVITLGLVDVEDHLSQL